MVKTLLLVKKLGHVATALMLLVLAIYWFELDDKFLKAFEPTFRKMSDWIKRQG